MADSLVDIGQGIKVVNPEVFKGADSLSTKDALSLVNLSQEIQARKLKAAQDAEDRPLEKAKKEADLALAENNVFNISTQNDLLKVQLNSALNKEIRDQKNFVFENIGKSIDLFKVDPNLGAQTLGLVIPGAQVTSNGDGAFTATIGQGDNKKQFLIDPNKVTDPEKRIQFENTQKNDFQKSTDDFNRISKFYSTIEKLGSQKDVSGTNDLAIVYAFAKMNDPQGRVTSSDQELAQGTPGLSSQIVNAYNKALKTGGPIFGPAGSQARKNFLNTSKIMYQTEAQNALNLGRNSYETAKRQGLDPKNVVAPVGALKVSDFADPKSLTNDELKDTIQRYKKLGIE